VSDKHPEEWRLKAQVKSEYCPAILVHGHGAGQCRLKPEHDGEHDVTCSLCWDNDESCQLGWDDPECGVTRWRGCVSDDAHMSHG
jgi:hypothetical protein